LERGRIAKKKRTYVRNGGTAEEGLKQKTSQMCYWKEGRGGLEKERRTGTTGATPGGES